MTVSFIASRTTTSTSDTASAAIADMCGVVVEGEDGDEEQACSTVSTMPRTPPNASNSAVSVTAHDVVGFRVAPVSSVGLSSDVTGYSRRGFSSYFGLKSTRRPRLIEIRPMR